MKTKQLWVRGLRSAVASAGVLALVGAAGAAGAGIATAAPGDSFTAPLCEGTDFTPLPEQITLTGERLENYNNGYVVPLYGNKPDDPLTVQYAPLCGVRNVDGTPIAEWMYCTDAAKSTCGGVAPEGWRDPSTRTDPTDPSSGELVEEGTPLNDWGSPVGPNEPQTGNPKLSGDQEKLIAYLLQHPIAWEGGATTDNTSMANRNALQDAVWCISDYDTAGNTAVCDQYLSEEKQAEILAGLPDDAAAVLELERAVPAPGDEIGVGETARFTLTTNIYDTPLTLNLPDGATVEVCEGAATIAGDAITVEGAGDASTSVTLCVTSDAEMTADLTVGATLPSVKNIQWNQATPISDPPAGWEGRWDCQVFATFDTQKPTLRDDASVTFVEDEEAGGTGSLGSLGSLGSTGGSLAGSLGSAALGSLGSLGDTGSGSTGEFGSTGDTGSGSNGETGSGSLGSLGDLGSTGDTGSGSNGEGGTGSAGDVVTGSLGSLGAGSAAVGSLGSSGSTAGSLGAGSAVAGSLGSLAAGGALGSEGGSLGSQHPEQPGQPEAPEQPGQPETPEQPGTPGNGGETNGGGSGGQSDTTGQQAERPHAINGGSAGVGFNAETGVGLAVALLVLGGAGAFVAMRRMRR
ncbi:hypothetical protein [Tomitella gaofuii]|uniref:hypothetical protein n=1 Tax=Tomitella gaofuii TaxID=2760083 RepID=UPI0015FB42B9|nr:hypothetical protein [Tomitella gaofuii]